MTWTQQASSLNLSDPVGDDVADRLDNEAALDDMIIDHIEQSLRVGLS